MEDPPIMTAARSSAPRVIVVLSSLCAEGTPVMAKDLCIQWRRSGIEPAILTLFDEPDEMYADFASLQVPILRAHLARSGWARYATMVRSIADASRSLRPDAILSMPFGWHAFLAVGARLAGVKHFAAHVGNYPASWEERGFWKFQTEVLLGRPFTGTLICCSEYVRDGVLRHFPVRRGRTTVVYNGCDVTDVARRAAGVRQAQTAHPFRVGMVARFERHKDQDTLIDAVAILSRRMPVELWLVGDGSRRGELERFAKERGVERLVRFLGARRDVPEILGDLDAFAFSAKPDEGLGIALIEAMAARVPVVATEVGACREVLDQGTLGRLVPYRDSHGMASALEDVARGGPELEARTEAAARKAKATFSKEAMATAYASELGLIV
jgi:glycosyltransferase involved in cell wall biosynthesis